MIKFFSGLFVLCLIMTCIVWLFGGCAAPQIKRDKCIDMIYLTETCCMEQSNYDEDTRTYHVRYASAMAVSYNLMGKTFEIEGIKAIVPQPYTMAVTKGAAYSWDEIEPKIIGVIKGFEKFCDESEEAPDASELEPNKQGI